MNPRILIVDDEPSIRRVLSAHLARDGYEVETAEDGAAAMALLDTQPFQAVVTDLKMPNIGGLELLAWCRQSLPGLPVVVITAHGTVDTAVEAIKLGAHDYITKPFDHDELRRIIGKAVRVEAESRKHLVAEAGRHDIIGKVLSMQRIFEMIDKVASSPTTVLVTGESGTGKELVAQALHAASDRASKPFIPVNCGAIPKELFESELFGHEKGAFTGAVASRAGRFELADGGTLFLDEVGELPPDLQVKLLRVLQERRFERVGGVRPMSVDVRLIAATNRDLKEASKRGEFRQDLYYRLNVIPIHLPPLRERTQDIPLLAEHFLHRFNERLGRKIKGISPAAMELLEAWSWPGNIRELENQLERAVLLSDGPWIEPTDLRGLAEEEEPEDETGEEPAGDPDGLNLKDYVRVHTARLERNRIQQALEAENHNVTRAARRLGISRKSLQTKMKEYGLREIG